MDAQFPSTKVIAMLLKDFLADYVIAHDTGVSAATVLCYYTPAISGLGRFLGREPELHDLSDDIMNDWVGQRLAAKANALTVRQRRSAILALWRAAFVKGLVSSRPERLRRITKPQQIIVAWTRDELKKLLEAIAVSTFATKSMPKSSLNKAAFFSTLAQVGYATGLRLGDLLSIEREWIRVDTDGRGYLTTIQKKTKLQKTSKIDAATMKSVDELMMQQPNRRLIWPLNCKRPVVYRTWKKLVAKSGIRKGTFRWIRRSGTTHVEQQSPGRGYIHAGHSDSRVTMAHYIDRSQLNSQIVAPESLTGIPLPPAECLCKLRQLLPNLSDGALREIMVLARSPA